MARIIDFKARDSRTEARTAGAEQAEHRGDSSEPWLELVDAEEQIKSRRDARTREPRPDRVCHRPGACSDRSLDSQTLAADHGSRCYSLGLRMHPDFRGRSRYAGAEGGRLSSLAMGPCVAAMVVGAAAILISRSLHTFHPPEFRGLLYNTLRDLYRLGLSAGIFAVGFFSFSACCA